MELLGGTVSDIRSEYQSQVPLSICMHIGILLLRCLKEFHGKGYIHRDVKPSNFMRPKTHTNAEGR